MQVSSISMALLLWMKGIAEWLSAVVNTKEIIFFNVELFTPGGEVRVLDYTDSVTESFVQHVTYLLIRVSSNVILQNCVRCFLLPAVNLIATWNNKFE